MISVEQAIECVVTHTPVSKKTKLPTEKSLGLVLAKDIISPINLPSFDNSAMDGFAINTSSIKDLPIELPLQGEIAAGHHFHETIKEGSAFRIFTGAPTPKNCNAVIIQEKCKINNGSVVINQQEVFPNQNIRKIGEQVEKGSVALRSGTYITAATIGYLHSIGVTTVTVYNPPKIALISTGDELINPGEKLQFGQIYNSNQSMLLSAFSTLPHSTIDSFELPDNLKESIKLLNRIVSEYDFVISTGGISVGDHDYIGTALKQLGANQHFYKVKQKPGKPLYFGTIEKCTVFALPGNPAAALTCFEVYIKTAIKKFIGLENPVTKPQGYKSGNQFVKKGDRAQFLKARICNETHKVEILEGQSSNMLHTFAIANALVFIPENKMTISEGEIVKTYRLK